MMAGKPTESSPVAGAPTSGSAPKQAYSAQIADDDSDDGLDELDDVLDDFVPHNEPAPAGPRPASQKPSGPSHGEDGDEPDPDHAAFERQLREQMEAVFKDLGENPEMKEELDALLGSIGNLDMNGPNEAASPPASAKPNQSPPTSAQSSAKPGQQQEPSSAFEEQILRAMNRMQESGDQASAAAAQGGDDGVLLELLKSLQDGSPDLSGDGEGSIANAITNIMSALLAKDILYEPMSELNQKFPTWLKENEGKVSKEDFDRYTKQRECVKAIVDRFDKPTYKDDSAEDRKFIQSKMDEMQSAGSPPADLVDESAVNDVLQQTGSCPVQ